jgi:hypothetical protein
VNSGRDKADKDRIAEGMSEAGHEPKQQGPQGKPPTRPADRLREGMSEAGHDPQAPTRDDDLRGGGPGRGAD